MARGHLQPQIRIASSDGGAKNVLVDEGIAWAPGKTAAQVEANDATIGGQEVEFPTVCLDQGCEHRLEGPAKLRVNHANMLQRA